jgi:hypothetical protein
MLLLVHEREVNNMIAYSKEEILAEVKDYLNEEYMQTARILTREPRPWWTDEKESKDSAVKRAMGAVMFAQRFHVYYDELEQAFEDFKNKIYMIEPTTVIEHRGGVIL